MARYEKVCDSGSKVLSLVWRQYQCTQWSVPSGFCWCPTKLSITFTTLLSSIKFFMVPKKVRIVSLNRSEVFPWKTLGFWNLSLFRTCPYRSLLHARNRSFCFFGFWIGIKRPYCSPIYLHQMLESVTSVETPYTSPYSSASSLEHLICFSLKSVWTSVEVVLVVYSVCGSFQIAGIVLVSLKASLS